MKDWEKVIQELGKFNPQVLSFRLNTSTISAEATLSTNSTSVDHGFFGMPLRMYIDYFMVGERVRFLFTSCEESQTNE